MKKDLRWLLIIAWPFAVIAVWEFISYFPRIKPKRLVITGLASILVVFGLYELNVWLKPSEVPLPQQVFAPSPTPLPTLIPTPALTPAQTPLPASPATKHTPKPTGMANCKLLVEQLLKRYQSQKVKSDVVAWVNEQSIKHGSDCRIRRHVTQGVTQPVLVDVIGGKDIDVSHVEGGRVHMEGVEKGTVSHIGDKTTITPTPTPTPHQ